MHTTKPTTFCLGLSVLLLGGLLCGIANATPRDTTVQALESAAAKASSESLRVQVNDGAGSPLRIGDNVVYRFESDRAGYLTAIHVDMQGTATLLYPRSDAGASKLVGGKAVTFPSSVDSFQLEVEPPTGRDMVYVFLSDSPIERRHLGINSDDIVVTFEPEQAIPFVETLVARLESAGGYRAGKVMQQIDGRGDVQYRSLDIANFFGQRTRSIKPAKLDLQIQFKTNSAQLDPKARRNIDEFAAALEDPRLASMRFAVAGHTDERGSEQHNETLSQRRAESVYNHLVNVGGIDPDRLEIEAHGELVPLMTDDSEYARQMNRRVEFMPIRE